MKKPGRAPILNFAEIIYRKLIDPMLDSSHRAAAEMVNSGERVLDVACGMGTLAILIGAKAGNVTGVDIDPASIRSARLLALESGVGNVSFMEADAIALDVIRDNEFDVSVISMALHQFSPETGVRVLESMKRVSGRIIIVDYAYPVKNGPYKALTWIIEWIAGGDHYRNFKKYMKQGGLLPLVDQAGLKAVKTVVKGMGTLTILNCEVL
ncbi:MAG: class I SAM-dependent methyltransferase [Bacteroidales bacterium]